MSIVERMVEMLGPNGRADAKSQAPERDGVRPGPDLIERAVGEMDARAGHASAESLAAGPKRTARGPKQAVAIDLAHLRRQGIITPDDVRTPIAESFRRVKRHVLQSAGRAKAGALANLVLVTSSIAQEGKTFCAVNLAISIAQEVDHTVLLVDADVAKPSIPQVLGFNAGKGLMDLLLDRRIDLSDVLCKTDIEKLSFLPAGTPHRRATELLASDAMRELLRELATRYRDRIVIFDSPPLLAASEASALANQMGEVVMVVEAGRTSEAALNQALSLVQSGNVGLLLNKGDSGGLEYGYGY